MQRFFFRHLLRLLYLQQGLFALVSVFTSALVFAGSMEFVLVTMLLSPFNPLYCFFMALMINSRHLFYGLSMLENIRIPVLRNFI